MELMKPGPNEMATLECIYYNKENKHDTHNAFDEKSNIFTIVAGREYIVKLSDGIWVRKQYKAGHKIKNPRMVISKSCGVFFDFAVEQMNGGK